MSQTPNECEHCGARLPQGERCSGKDFDRDEVQPMTRVSFPENGQTVYSSIPSVCLKRVPS